MGIFDDKLVPVVIEEQTFTFNVNRSYADIQKMAALGDAEMINAVLVSWSLEGLTIEIEGEPFKFPKVPTLEAIKALPLYLIKQLAGEFGAAIGNAIPKPTGGK